jgi:LPXTG-motif cell wall-anchored protein
MTALARIVLAATLLFALGLAPATGWAHGGEEMEAENLSEQPARTLAQQAMSELRVRHDMETAATQLDAAVESHDKADVDAALLNQAMETLDAGNETDAVILLDQALSKPLGETSGAALHESGREFQPATGAQEIVAIVVGALLLLLAAFLLLRGRRPGARST